MGYAGEEVEEAAEVANEEDEEEGNVCECKTPIDEANSICSNNEDCCPWKSIGF